MSAAPETIPTDSATIACDGDRDSPHPRVFLTMNAQGCVACPYCGQRFVLKAGAQGGDAH